MGPQQARRSLAAASRAGQTGSILFWITLFTSIVIAVLVFFSLIFLSIAFTGSVFKPVASAGNGNYLGVMKEPVQDRRGRRNITEQFSPVFQRSV